MDANEIHTMDNKISAIEKFPQPRTVENIRSFIGLCGYYRTFIDEFAKIAPPLTKRLKKEIPFHWNATQEKSLADLKVCVDQRSLFSVPGLQSSFHYVYGCLCPRTGYCINAARRLR